MSRPGFSRRRFLAVVVGASGAWMVPGRARPGTANAVGTPNDLPDAGLVPPGPDPADPVRGHLGNDVEVLRVEAGFVDATSFNGDLLTLRASPSGIVVRAELAQHDFHVHIPDGFAGRCLGVAGNQVVIGGHRVAQTGSMTFEAGISYEALLAHAGTEAERLAAQPGRALVEPYRHVFVERFPALLTTQNLRDWQHVELPSLLAGTGGSFGAVLERSGVLAADHYAIAEVPDSVFEASLISLPDALGGDLVSARAAIPVDHGSLWGSTDDGASDVLIMADRGGITGYGSENKTVLRISNEYSLLGVNFVDDSYLVSVQTRGGTRQVMRFSNGTEHETVALSDDTLIKHRISANVTISALDGKRVLVPHTNVAQGLPT